MSEILIVEDDARLRDILRDYLEENQYQVSEAASGQEALIQMDKIRPDAIISDVSMPEMDGFELCRRVRASRSYQFIPFIFLSARGQVDDRLQGYRLGADDYLVKPFELWELGAKLKMLLERTSRLQREMLQVLQMVDHSESGVSPPQVEELGSHRKPDIADELPLTPAEVQVFGQVALGLTNKEIGDRLFISHRTVQTHVSHILQKLNLSTRSQLIRLAAQRGELN
ncbi:MAG: response regulator transcription factor [Phormidium sp.]